MRTLGPHDLANRLERRVQHVPIEEDDCRGCLVLGRRTYLPANCERRHEVAYMARIEPTWMPQPMKADVASDPSEICLLGPRTVMPRSQHSAYLIEKPRFPRRWNGLARAED